MPGIITSWQLTLDSSMYKRHFHVLMQSAHCSVKKQLQCLYVAVAAAASTWWQCQPFVSGETKGAKIFVRGTIHFFHLPSFSFSFHLRFHMWWRYKGRVPSLSYPHLYLFPLFNTTRGLKGWVKSAMKPILMHFVITRNFQHIHMYCICISHDTAWRCFSSVTRWLKWM